MVGQRFHWRRRGTYHPSLSAWGAQLRLGYPKTLKFRRLDEQILFLNFVKKFGIFKETEKRSLAASIIL